MRGESDEVRALTHAHVRDTARDRKNTERAVTVKPLL